MSMTDARSVMSALLGALVPVPSVPQVGVCDLCHSSVDPAYQRCWQCNLATSLDPPEVLSITMEPRGELIHNHLRGYKDDADAAVRGRKGYRLAALLSVFLANHSGCVGEWDLVTCVPSPGRVALEPVVKMVRVLEPLYASILTERNGGPSRELSADRFMVTQDIDGRRVLLLDDTFTSGSAIFSAAATIRKAGATVVGPVVIGRFVDERWPPSAALMEWLRPRAWDEERCARCDGQVRPNSLL
jgi:predicted amidophosphoribosyltransferase